MKMKPCKPVVKAWAVIDARTNKLVLLRVSLNRKFAKAWAAPGRERVVRVAISVIP